MSSKILILFLFISLLAWSSADAESQPETSQSGIKKNFIALNNSKQSRGNRSTGNEANCADSSTNSTLIVINAVQQLFQTQFNKLDDKLKKTESRVESQLNQQKACNVCEPNPCIYGGSCVSILCGKDFLCDKCPVYRSGVRCEKIHVDCVLNSNCWEYNDTLYVLLEPKSSWTAAERKCQGKGMRLIMPKEKDQTEFIVNKLKAIYGTVAPHFWMGLKREAGSGWRWLDGSELGNYTGGQKDFKGANGDQYGLLYLHGKDHDMWYWYGPTVNNIYPLCEKRVYAH